MAAGRFIAACARSTRTASARRSASTRSTWCRCPTPAARSRSWPRSAARSLPRRSSRPCASSYGRSPTSPWSCSIRCRCFVHADVNADPQAAAITMALLNMLAAETGATVLATHHVRKEKEAPKTAPGGPPPDPRQLGPGRPVPRCHRAVDARTSPTSRKVCKALGGRLRAECHRPWRRGEEQRRRRAARSGRCCAGRPGRFAT